MKITLPVIIVSLVFATYQKQPVEIEKQIPFEPHEYSSYEIETISYSNDELELASRTVWSEARGEGVAGQTMVAQSIADRVLDGRWGSTVTEVLTAKNQYASPGQLDPKITAVVKDVFDGNRFALDHSVLYFRVSKSTSDWWSSYVGHIGNHAYYGNKL